MAVLFTRAKLDEIKRKLDGVRSVGQAWAVITATQKLGDTIASEIKQSLFEDAWRAAARKDIYAYQASVQREARQLIGAAATADAATSWKSIRPVVQTLWNYCLIVQGQFPPNETTAMERLSGKMSEAASALAYGVENAPANIVKGTQAAAKVAKTVARTTGVVLKEVADATGGVVGGLLGPVKWYLLGAAVILVAGGVVYFTVQKKMAGL
jgi:hypothetical protein